MSLEKDWSYVEPRINLHSRESILEIVEQLSQRVDDNRVEFGVAEGHSTRIIRRVLTQLERDQVGGRHKKIFACDSFKGLTEKFENAEVGTFACEPPIIPGVEIVEGYFQDSLTPELAQR